MSKSIFVDDNHNILVGETAEGRLLAESDKPYFDETAGRGIDRVPLDRWHTAQAYERKTWMKMGLSATNDRNLDYVLAFNKYGDLRGLTFEHAIELGCGPFTNLRLLSWPCRILRCTLLDPLADMYLEHPYCFYNRQFLYRDPRFFFLNFARSRLGRIIYRLAVPKRIYGKIPIDQIIPKPIEAMSVQSQYDLVVIMNVLEHCYDVDLIFDKIRSIAKEGTVLVFRDKYYDHAQIAQDVEIIYDAGHPLRIDRRLIDEFLEINFVSIFRAVEKVSFFVGRVDRSYNVLNFVGRFKG